MLGWEGIILCDSYCRKLISLQIMIFPFPISEGISSIKNPTFLIVERIAIYPLQHHNQVLLILSSKGAN